ncbi:hypothetical protein Pmar_PMAR006819, partial [Perkinsus marinus ATCC 50983]
MSSATSSPRYIHHCCPEAFTPPRRGVLPTTTASCELWPTANLSRSFDTNTCREAMERLK